MRLQIVNIVPSRTRGPRITIICRKARGMYPGVEYARSEICDSSRRFFIDRNYASFDKILPIYKSLKMPAYHTLGNHDFDVVEKLKSKVPERMGMQARYYDFVLEGWRFIVLDGNDVSFHAYPKDSLKYSEAEASYKENKVRSPKWNGAVGEEQLAWMRKILEGAEEKGRRLFCIAIFQFIPPILIIYGMRSK